MMYKMMIYVCVAKFGSKKLAEFPIQLKIDFSANCQERFQAVVMFVFAEAPYQDIVEVYLEISKLLLICSLVCFWT